LRKQFSSKQKNLIVSVRKKYITRNTTYTRMIIQANAFFHIKNRSINPVKNVMFSLLKKTYYDTYYKLQKKLAVMIHTKKMIPELIVLLQNCLFKK
jgi:hypothetical protein